MGTVTAPGRDVLPWDESHCAHRGPHRHDGRLGCRCEPLALWKWSSTLPKRWTRMSNHAAIATRRGGFPEFRIWALAWEPQKRGAPHVHVICPVDTARERAAFRSYLAHLQRLAPQYGFGNVDQSFRAFEPSAAAAYISSYFVRGRKEKAELVANVSDPNLPCRLLYVSPKLLRPAGISMRLLRQVRRYWAWGSGFAPRPEWSPEEWGLVLALANPGSRIHGP